MGLVPMSPYTTPSAARDSALNDSDPCGADDPAAAAVVALTSPCAFGTPSVRGRAQALRPTAGAGSEPVRAGGRKHRRKPDTVGCAARGGGCDAISCVMDSPGERKGEVEMR